MVLGWDVNRRRNTEVSGGDPVYVVEKVALVLNKDVQSNSYLLTEIRYFILVPRRQWNTDKSFSI